MAKQSDYDGPWKELITTYFPDFMGFFFPKAHADIDWELGHEFLDKELRQVSRDAEIGARLADKLVKVWRKGGDEIWVLVHVEVQASEEGAFTQRMFVYNYRIFDRYKRPVASLAILTDDRPAWRPDRYGYSIWDCEMGLRFPVAKLTDYAERWTELEQSDNPFAAAVMAHLKARETLHDASERQRWKFILVRRLYEKGYDRAKILGLFHYIDWMMNLPDKEEKLFWEELEKYEEAKTMPYVTSVERIGIKKGVQQGIQQGIQQGVKQGIQQGIQQGVKQGIQQGIQQGVQQGLSGLLLRQLQKKFGPLVDKQIAVRVSTASASELERWGEKIMTASKPSEVFDQE